MMYVYDNGNNNDSDTDGNDKNYDKSDYNNDNDINFNLLSSSFQLWLKLSRMHYTTADLIPSLTCGSTLAVLTTSYHF